MVLEKKDLQNICDSMIEAAVQAGKYICANQNKHFEVRKKDGVDSLASQVVTEVDLKSQEMILERLLPSVHQFNLALLTEESIDTKERLQKNYFLCIDPLDGTLSFTESMPGYAVSISLISKDGIPYIGVVYDPVRDNLYHAIKGIGVWKNKNEWMPKENTGNRLAFYFNRSFKTLPLFNRVVDNLNEIARKNNLKSVEAIQAGGAVMNAITALENSPACFFAFPKKAAGGGSFWDYAATACIYAEFGLPHTDIFGNHFHFNRPESTFMNSYGVLYATNQQLANDIQELHLKLKAMIE